MTTEQPTTPPVVLSTALLERFEEAVGSYWDCAYQEGHLNRPDGDKANEILHEIRCAVAALVAAEREACAAECEREMTYPGGRQASWAHHGVQAAARAIRLRSNAGDKRGA